VRFGKEEALLSFGTKPDGLPHQDGYRPPSSPCRLETSAPESLNYRSGEVIMIRGQYLHRVRVDPAIPPNHVLDFHRPTDTGPSQDVGVLQMEILQEPR
jgi:hypothetical protein